MAGRVKLFRDWLSDQTQTVRLVVDTGIFGASQPLKAAFGFRLATP